MIIMADANFHGKCSECGENCVPYSEHILMYFDGACEPHNPGGYMGIGVHIVNEDSGEIIYEHSKSFDKHPTNTNNVAEYLALKNGLEWLLENYRNAKILVHGDSKLAINQMAGEWAIRKGDYVHIAKDCLRNLVPFFNDIKFEWIPRELNQIADDLSKKKLSSIGVKGRNEKLTPHDKMPWGVKYRDRFMLKEVPVDYLIWCYKNMQIPENLKTYIEQYVIE